MKRCRAFLALSICTCYSITAISCEEIQHHFDWSELLVLSLVNEDIQVFLSAKDVATFNPFCLDPEQNFAWKLLEASFLDENRWSE